MYVLEIYFVVSHFSSDFCDSACCSNISYHDLAQYLRKDNFLFLRSNFGGVWWAGAALQALRLIRVGGRCIFCVGLCTFGVRLLFLSPPPPLFVSPCFPLMHFGLKPSTDQSTQPFCCFTLSHTCTSFPGVWVSSVVIQVNPDNPCWFGFALQKNRDKLMFGNLVTKSFLLAKDFMISLISSVAYPSLLSHFKEPKVQSKIVDWISSFCFLTQYFFIIFNFFILKRMWSQNNNNN